jgi:hypothetical protein
VQNLIYAKKLRSALHHLQLVTASMLKDRADAIWALFSGARADYQQHNALRTLPQIDLSYARQSILIPAT